MRGNLILFLIIINLYRKLGNIHFVEKLKRKKYCNSIY